MTQCRKALGMLALWTALIGVLAGGLLSTATSYLQQRRTWNREDLLRADTRAVERRREERRETLMYFTDYLAACNRANLIHALPSSADSHEQRGAFVELVTERAAAVQAAGVAFMVVGDDEGMRQKLAALMDATWTILGYLRNLTEPTQPQQAEFSRSRRACEASMREFLLRLR